MATNAFRRWVSAHCRCSVPGCDTRPVDPDHVRTRGAVGEVDENNVWPLCRAHHMERGQMGVTSFMANYGIDAFEIARAVWARWLKVRHRVLPPDYIIP